MIGDSITQDTAAPPLDPKARYGAASLYGAQFRVPFALVAQDLVPANDASELNISNYSPVMVQQQMAGQSSQAGILGKLTSVNPRLAWVPQITTGPQT